MDFLHFLSFLAIFVGVTFLMTLFMFILAYLHDILIDKLYNYFSNK